MLYLVVNKYSGSYSKKKMNDLERELKSYFEKYSFNETILIEGKISINIDADMIMKDDIITAVGGDGTINACLQFIHDHKLQEKVKLGIIPLGTGNNMLKSLMLSKNFHKALEILKSGMTEKISYGTVNGNKAFFNCSLGFSSHVLKNRKTNSVTGYFYDTLRLLPAYKGTRIKFQDEDKHIDIFAGFFINTKIYMSKFKFLKNNNSENQLCFFYIDRTNILKTHSKAALSFFSSKFYKKIEKVNFKIEISKDCDLELDGDIYNVPDRSKVISISNNSFINVITNN